MKLSGEKYFISNVKKENINDEYINWLNNEEVNKYLEIRHQKQNFKTVLNYIQSLLSYGLELFFQ